MRSRGWWNNSTRDSQLRSPACAGPLLWLLPLPSGVSVQGFLCLGFWSVTVHDHTDRAAHIQMHTPTHALAHSFLHTLTLAPMHTHVCAHAYILTPLMLTPLCTHKCTPSRACRRKAISWRRTALGVCTLRLKFAHTGPEVPGSRGLSFLISLPCHSISIRGAGHVWVIIPGSLPAGTSGSSNSNCASL